MDISSRIKLNNGVMMPRLGLGVYKSGENTKQAVLDALEAGYRLIDTAAFYGNEREVGEAIRESGIKREEIFVTTKIWNNYQREHRQIEAFNKSMEALGLDYIDLYLIHWPVKECIAETWSVLEGFYKANLIKSIGVSNFLQQHLEEIEKTSDITPSVNQLQLSPFGSRPELREYMTKKGIVAEAWSPLARGAYFDHEIIKSIAQKHLKTPAQVMLRWDIQSDIVTIPKSTHKDRIIGNADIFDFELTNEEMAALDSLNEESYSHDPDNIDF